MVVSSHESLDWWAKMSPVFEEYLADSYLCDIWFVCEDTIVSAHKLVLAQLGDWNKKSSTMLEILESDEAFVTLDGWTGDQITQMLIEIYNTETKSLGSETKIVLQSLGIKFDESQDTTNDDLNNENLDMDVSLSDDSNNSCTKDKGDEEPGSLDVSFTQCVVCSCNIMTHSKINDKSKLEYFCCIESCNKHFAFTSDFSEHMKDHSTLDKSESDDVFEKVLEKVSELCAEDRKPCCLCNDERRNHKNDRPEDPEKGSFYNCCKCSASNLSTDTFFIHVEHHLAKTVGCAKCELKFSYQHLLDEHLRISHVSPVKLTFNCLYGGCDYKANSKQTLNVHVKGKHKASRKLKFDSKDTRTIMCPTCQKTVKSWYYEKYHKKTCGGKSVVYQCDICDKSGFVNSATLQNHVRAAHSDEKPFACEHCDMAFARSESLSKHRASNHGVNFKGEVVARKLFSCDYCGKLLTSKTKLVSHVKVIHEGVKEYKCKFCDKTFGSKNNLEIHEGAMHTGKLPYQCYYCKKSFSRKNLLNDHQVTHTKNKNAADSDMKPTTSKTVNFDDIQYVTHLDDVDNQEIVDNLNKEDNEDSIIVSEQIMEVDEHGKVKGFLDL